MHINNGNCQGCLSIFQKYPGFYEPLQDWFFLMQNSNPTFHISCAGRGRIDQEAAFSRKASNAHFGQSAHNFNLGIDTFFLIDGQYSLARNLYDSLMQNLDSALEWYGSPGAEYFELPHIQVKDWKNLVDSGLCKIVEN